MLKHKVQSAGELVRLRVSTHGLQGADGALSVLLCSVEKHSGHRATGAKSRGQAEQLLRGRAGRPLLPNCRIRPGVLKATTAIALQRAGTWHAARARNKTVYVATEKK